MSRHHLDKSPPKLAAHAGVAKKFIIDGQQRLTTLTLLLIYLQHQLPDADQRSQLAELIVLAEVRQAVVQPRHPRRGSVSREPFVLEARAKVVRGEGHLPQSGTASVAHVVVSTSELPKLSRGAGGLSP